MDSSDLLGAFNNHIIDFFEEVVKLFPNNTDIKIAKTSINTIRRVNPKLIIRIWKEYILDKYKTEIYDGNIDFFINKNYTNDLKNLDTTNNILEKIDTLREPISKMSKENVDKTIKYIQNLTKLCDLYYV